MKLGDDVQYRFHYALKIIFKIFTTIMNIQQNTQKSNS